MKTIGVFCVLLCLTAAALGAASKSGKAKPVPHDQLKALLPNLPGWTRGEVNGETVTEDVPISRVQVDYDKASSSLAFELMDTVMNKDLLAQSKPLMAPGYSEKRKDGYTKAITLGGFPGTEEWTTIANNGYISVLVGGRFMLKVTGSSVANIEIIRAAVEAVDLQKLAALK